MKRKDKNGAQQTMKVVCSKPLEWFAANRLRGLLQTCMTGLAATCRGVQARKSVIS